MGKTVLWCASLVLVLAGAGCYEDDLPNGSSGGGTSIPELPPPITLDPPALDVELLYIDSRDDGSWRFDDHARVLHPCDCPDYACLQAFAAEQFGCDLCVTLLCDGGDKHVCTSCDD